MSENVLDVLVLGAGVSGIGMACTLKRECPDKTFVVLERRARLGGTWDLFRYPGVRSDSDMHSYAYAFRPWRSSRVLGDAASIRDYLSDTARELSIEPHIRFGVEVASASWSSEAQCWTVLVRRGPSGTADVYRARFLVFGTGYYDHSAGYVPDLPELDRFRGSVVHPQHWPESLDVRGKRVVVVGSGATAVSLVPALAASGAEVTMLQRSPSYLFSMPSLDPLVGILGRLVSERRVYAISRALNIRLARLLYRAARRFPKMMRRLLLSRVRGALGEAADMRNFSPHYEPWAQRLCIVADGDLFAAIRERGAQVATDRIVGFEADAVRLQSGRMLPADIVVTATGLELQALGGIEVVVDGTRYDVSRRMLYRGALLEGAPNVAWIVGYVNASWTLKADLVAGYVCRLLRHLEAAGHGAVVPVDTRACRLPESILDVLESGYVRRSQHVLPRQGAAAPWRVTHDYAEDRRQLLDAPIDDGVLRFAQRLSEPNVPRFVAAASGLVRGRLRLELPSQQSGSSARVAPLGQQPSSGVNAVIGK